MAVTRAILDAILNPSPSGKLLVLGKPYEALDPGLVSFVAEVGKGDDFEEDWPSLKAALVHGLADLRAPLADARLLVLFSHYLVAVRTTATTGEWLPPGMMSWIGKSSQRLPVENIVWFLLETQHVGSEAVRDVINVFDGANTFMEHYMVKKDEMEILEQAGIYLSILLHLRLKWPDYYTWMQLEERTYQMKSLLLLGNEEVQVVRRKAARDFVSKPVVDVYLLLSKTMYQTSFYILLRTYVQLLQANKGAMTLEIFGFREKLLAD
jgi:hypothetical protein